MASQRGVRTPYKMRAWKATRLFVLNRDGWTCQLRRPGCTGTATEADHIMHWNPDGSGGPWIDPLNLRAACKHCNSGRRRGASTVVSTPDGAVKPSRDW